MKVHNIKKLRERRVELRQKSTKPETILWNELRKNKLGLKFKRQHSVGGYILDFYCAKKKLVLEIDGKSHNSIDSKAYDAIRDKFFHELDYIVLRFKNYEVENDLNKVLNRIQRILDNPSPCLGEGEGVRSA